MFQNYLFYRDFLADLDTYRRMQKLEKKHSKCVTNEEALESNTSNDSTPLLPPLPMSSGAKKALPISMMAEFMARREPNNKSGHPVRHSIQ